MGNHDDDMDVEFEVVESGPGCPTSFRTTHHATTVAQSSG